MITPSTYLGASSPPSTSLLQKSKSVVHRCPCVTRSNPVINSTTLIRGFKTRNQFRLKFEAAVFPFIKLFRFLRCDNHTCRAERAMKELKGHPPATGDLRKMGPGSKALYRQTLTKVKNARLRRLRIRRLKYTCEAKIHVAVTAGDLENSSGEEKNNGHLDNKEREIHDATQITLSLTSEGNDRSVLRNDAVLADFGDEIGEGNDDRKELSYGMVSVIGSRKEMEDAVSIEMGFVVKEEKKCDFFAVYDGHGGSQVANACRERLHQLVAEEVERLESGDKVDWEAIMEGCFSRMDGVVSDNEAARTVGSTAVVALVADDVVVVANCGDSRAVMGRGGEALALSIDHKPDRPDELTRIEAAGGRVINWNGQRVLGVLATSRSIGDRHLQPYVISKPEVTVTRRSNKDEFLILASDGLWDVICNEVACQLVRKCLSGQIAKHSSEVRNQSQAAEAAALLTELAMAKGSKDNTSVIVVELRSHNL